MKNKMLILIGLVFLLCGCSAEVNLEIKNNKVSETIIIDAYPEGDYTLDRLPKAFRTYIPAYEKDILTDTESDVKKNGVSYYTRTQDKTTNGYRFTYKYDFTLSKYKDSRSVSEGFKSANIYVDKKEKTITLSTDNGGLLYFNQYPWLSDVTIKIKTDYKVKDSNADSKYGNVYTWNFSRNDNRKNIYLLLDDGTSSTNDDEPAQQPSKEDNVTKKEENDEIDDFFNQHPFLLIIGGIILFIIVVVIISKITVIK